MALPSKFVKNTGAGGDPDFGKLIFGTNGSRRVKGSVNKSRLFDGTIVDSTQEAIEDTLLPTSPTTPSRQEGLLKRQRKLGRGRVSLISGGRINGLSGVLG